MQAGKLRHRVTIQQPVESSPNEYNEDTITWTDVCKVWAEIVPTTAAEFQRNERISMDSTHVVTIRYRSGLDSTMRVVYDSRNLNIDSIINKDERGIRLELVCKEEVV